MTGSVAGHDDAGVKSRTVGHWLGLDGSQQRDSRFLVVHPQTITLNEWHCPALPGILD
jgi:hypothetical protein